MPKKINTESELMDNLEVCKILGVNPSTWRMRVLAGTSPLPHCRMGSRGYYKRADIRLFIDKGMWPAGTKFKKMSPNQLS